MPNEELQKEIEELKKKVKSLESFTSISNEVEQAFRIRLGVENLASNLGESGKSATSENQAVNEAGMDSYDVLKKPDSFLEVNISGTLYYIPVFT